VIETGHVLVKEAKGAGTYEEDAYDLRRHGQCLSNWRR
jgi:hypothetical protein